MYSIGVDIGGTSLRIGLVDEKFCISDFEKYPVDTILGDSSAEKLADFIKEYIIRRKVHGKIGSACIGFPATVDKKRETVLSAPNLVGFDGINVKKEIGKFFDFPIYIEKDVNLLLLGDLERMNISASDIVACYIGTGLGNAIMINGTLVAGHNGVAGELGHIPFGDEDFLCGCGNVGCVETRVGGKYLSQLVENDFKDTDVSDIFAAHSEDDKIKRYLDRLARTVASEINILDHELLILGGGIPSMKGFPKEEFASLVLKYTRKPLPADNLKIVFSEGDGDIGVLGAGIFAQKAK